MIDRERIVAMARGWIGTPYRHQASCKGAGADCLGLIRGLWRELYGHEPEAMPPYGPDWAEAGGRETFLEAARRHMREVDVAQARPGEVLLFRWRDGAPAKHAALLTTPETIIHAYEGVSVVESPFVPAWRRRVAAAFSFPEVF
ncbi:C40 family peptidase [Rhizobiales bacterium]|uniref:NlpC/P60 family protein n=1 Tax=Hongsoonwoonella zoysiae TaxID=2821844 RepID=UPI0015615788|nr:NlpC/P60 family protein [Hongsoonwoonella zoysiae]NRG19385.1 C40 family peptidase [Hongsoonwoonella zoysiae]